MTRKPFRKLEEEAIESSAYLTSDEKSSNFRNSGPIDPKFEKIETHPTVKPWVHFVAGGIGGMAGAVATCPFSEN